MTNKGMNLIFANNLKQEMHKSNMKSVDISRIAGVGKSTVSEWLSGDKYPRMDKVKKLAEHFNIHICDLIEEKNAVDCELEDFDHISKIEGELLHDFRTLSAVEKQMVLAFCGAKARISELEKKSEDPCEDLTD
ncbi:MAG: helix-turn-helix transcriptional regulator [Selenomonadaceae bacterium]